MFGKSIKLFTMFGFSVKVDLSWLVILVLIIWSLAGGVFPEQYKGLSKTTYFVMGVAGAIGLFGSIVFHELSHSLVARRFGLPIRGITLFIFGGVAEMTEEPANAKVEFFMAAAGPFSSIVLSAVFLGAAYFGVSNNWPAEVNEVLHWVGYINGILAAFNLVPGFPLDGGRVLRSALWQWKGNFKWATRVAAQVGELFGGLLLLLGFFNLLMLNPIGGLWWILIGMFLRSAAKQSYQQVVMREALAGEPVSRFMTAEPVTVAPTTTVGKLVEDFIYRYHFKMFPVVSGDRLLGCVSTQEVKGVPRPEWERRTAGEVAVECSLDNTIGPGEDTMKALTRMTQTQASRLMVVDNGHLVGVITLKDLLNFLALKLELEGEESGKGGKGSGTPLVDTRA